MQMVLNVALALLVFCAIVIIHELGHFIAAKLCGIQVNEFALGMGPVIVRWQGKETAYVIRLLPIGGAVTMEGESEDSDNPRAFQKKPVWQRMIVILAGATMNLILGFFVVMISLGLTENIASTTISGFREQSVSSVQLQEGDRIKSINGLPIFTSTDIIYKIQSSTDRNEAGNLIYDFTVLRNGETITLNDVELKSKVDENGKSSVYFDFYVLPLEKNFINLVSESFMESLSTGRLVIMSLVDMLAGRYNINDLSGPVGVVTVVAQSVSYDITDFLRIVSLITINLGVFNLLPIPALDGSRFLFLVIEAIRRKPLKPEVEGMIHLAGFGLLFLLLIVVTFNDIVRLVTGGFGG